MMTAPPALRLAWREARAAAPKFLFVIFGVACGVGALTGVRGFSAAFHDSLRGQARTLMASDLMIRQFFAATPPQQAELQRWVERGARMTAIIETVSMLAAGPDAAPVLVSVKAVDPAVYPFYGRVQLEPPAALADVLTAESIAVSEDLLARLNLAPGATVKLGEAPFRIAAIVRLEPDRMTGSLNVGPRVMLSAAGYQRTGLETFGARAFHRYLFRLPAQGIEVAAMQAALKKAFPEALIADYREPHPFITRALERATTFLSLISMIALIVGALGVATAVHSHIQQRLDTIAILKCLGARSSQIVGVFTLQTVLLGLSGGTAGIAVGALVQKLFPLLLRKYFQLGQIPWNPAFALEGILAGTLVTLLFTLPPLLAVRQVKPAQIFRRAMAEARPRPAQRLRSQTPALLSAVVIVAGLAALAGWVAQSAKMGAYFVGGLSAALLALAAVAWLLLRLLRRMLKLFGARLPIALRHGMANLYRPGNHATSVLVSLGIGVMFTLTIYLVQKSLLVEVMGAAPKGSPNVFMINITARDHDAYAAFLAEQPKLEAPPRIQAQVAARAVSVDGRPIEDHDDSAPPQNQAGPHRHRHNFTRQVSWRDAPPAGVSVRSGAWWKADETSAVMSVGEFAAGQLGLKLGSVMRWTSVGKEFDVRVVALHRVETPLMGVDEGFIFNRAALNGLPAQWFASIRMKPADVAGFQRLSYRRFPAVTVINAADVLSLFQEVIDQVAMVVRFISAFAILAGAIILASAVAGTRLRRSRESAVLKTIGARRRHLVAIFSVEFAILGAVAGLMGGLLATTFARLLLTRFLDARFNPELLPNLVTLGLTTTLAVGAGWLASLRILSQRPLEVLRDE